MPFKIIWCLLLMNITALSMMAQYITQGPAIGGVTQHQARMYLRTPGHTFLQVQLDSTGTFVHPQTFADSTRRHLDNSVIIDLTGLQPDTRYQYRILVNGVADTVQGSFRTFPNAHDKGTYTFVTGSCQETPNMKVFDVIPRHNPYFLLHTGDYTYPDYQMRHDYSANYDLVAVSYQRRYDEKVMKQMLHHIPIDYIYDDNDFVGMSGGRYYKNHNTNYSNLIFRKQADNRFYAIRYPDYWRRNCIKGYCEFFPGYQMVDTTVGIHHSFRFGNAEFFFLDRCSNAKDPMQRAFKYNKKRDRYYFDPPADHYLYGKEQMDWLKQGLKNSDADWKFIVSGVPFNKAIAKLIYAGSYIQKIGWKDNNGFRLMTGFAHYWAAYPAEQYDFFRWMEDEGITDVIAISGDTHHNVMDDGRNAGIPEMNASGLSVTETYLAYYLDLIGKVTGRYQLQKEVWNQGGNGLGNKNFKNAFGKVTIVNDEYVELSIIDEDDEVISSFKVYHSSQNLNRKGKPKKK